METTPIDMTTLTGVLEKLRIKKQDTEFRYTPEGFCSSSNKRAYEPEDLTIIKTYRFEGDSNPSDSCILYLIEAKDGLIGYNIDSYGAYSNNEEGYNDFLKKIKVSGHHEQLSGE
jgi:hypothetical protein